MLGQEPQEVPAAEGREVARTGRIFRWLFREPPGPGWTAHTTRPWLPLEGAYEDHSVLIAGVSDEWMSNSS